MNIIYNDKIGKESKSEQDQNDSRVGFEPRSLDGPSDTSIKFEHYRNVNDSKTDSNALGMSGISGLRDSKVMESFAKRPRQSDTSHVDDSLRRKLDDTDTGVSRIEKADGDETFLFNKSNLILNELDGEDEIPDEYDDDDDAGFFTIEAGEGDFLDKCKQLAVEYNYPAAAVKPPDETDLKYEKQRNKKLDEERKKEDETMSKQKKKDADADKDKLRKALGQKKDDVESEGDSDESVPSQLPKWVKFVPCENEFYPAEFNGIVYDCYNLKVVFDREKTGFEESREFPIVPNSVIAGRFQVMEFLGQAAFSKAIRCYDLHKGEEVCMKIIENNKDYYDQSIDEIKLLRYINANCDDVDEENVIKLIDFFYHKEHLFIVTELLKDNLYEFYKYNREREKEIYFTLGRLQKITKQI
jgi:hypothetical protein